MYIFFPQKKKQKQFYIHMCIIYTVKLDSYDGYNKNYVYLYGWLCDLAIERFKWSQYVMIKLIAFQWV